MNSARIEYPNGCNEAKEVTTSAAAVIPVS